MRVSTSMALLALSLTIACGDDRDPVYVEQGPGDDVGYAPGDKDVVIVDGTPWIAVGDPDGECVKIGDECVDWDKLKEEHCGSKDAQADIVIVDGKVVEVICYPPKDGGTSIQDVPTDGSGNPELPQNANNTVITFPESTNGKPVQGNVRLDAEKVVVIGNGVDKTIIAGNLEIASNNAKVRGLTVSGNVVFEKNANNGTLAFCKIEGNLVIQSNDVSVVGCLVFGNVEVQGNSASLIGLGVQGDIVVTGSVATCSNNYAMDDKDGDFLLDAGEKGKALDCGKPQ